MNLCFLKEKLEAHCTKIGFFHECEEFNNFKNLSRFFREYRHLERDHKNSLKNLHEKCLWIDPLNFTCFLAICYCCRFFFVHNNIRDLLWKGKIVLHKISW